MTAGLFRREVERAIAAIVSTGRSPSDFSFCKADLTFEPIAFVMTVSRGELNKAYVSDDIDWLAQFVPELVSGAFDTAQ